MLYSTPNPHGGDLYSRKICLDFSANINPYGTPEAVKQAVIDSVSDLRHYPDPYFRELREPLLEKGIQIRSCANYPGLEAGWYRIAVKLPRENETLLAALKEILR